MKRLSVTALAIFALSAQTSTGWVTLFDGKHLNNFNTVGNANWKLADGIVEATTGTGFLVSKETYGDFELKVEFWVDENANSGVYMRCQDSAKITDMTCYEANVFDKRPDQSGRSGAIVHISKPSSIIDTGGKWNTYELTARGPRLIVKLNGVQTVDVEDKKFAKGPIALQYAAGTVRFRNVQIRPL
jgi:hypothetical protein